MRQISSVEPSDMPSSIMRRGRAGSFHFQACEPQASQTLVHDGRGGQVRGDGVTLPSEVWGAETTSGVQVMDQLHYDVFDAMDALSRSTDHEFGTAYRTFARRIEHAFRQEEHWMDEIDFSDSGAHQEQHARILGALHNVHSRVMDGDLQVGREVVDQLLPQWFAFHLSTMDATLALAMQMAPAEAAKPSPADEPSGVFSAF